MHYSIKDLKNLASYGVITHSATFHADDVLSASLLFLCGVIDNFKTIKRYKIIPNNFLGLCFDIGGGPFDHHQENSRIRSNGIKFASFGLIWDAIGCEYIMTKFNLNKEFAQQAQQLFDKQFVEPLDQTDNFGQAKYPNAVAYLIDCANFLDEKIDTNSKLFFYKEAEFWVPKLERAIEKCVVNAQLIQQAKEISQPIMELDLYPNLSIPAYLFEGTRTKLVIEKSNRGGYKLTAVEPYKISLKQSEMTGCLFLHHSGFMGVFNTKENALGTAQKLLKTL